MQACSAPKCKNSPPEQPGKLYYLFPQSKSPKVLQKWIDNLGRKNWHPSKFSLLCSDHFHPDCFTKEGRLKKDAIPTLFHPHCLAERDSQGAEKIQKSSTSCSSLTSKRKENEKKQICVKKKKKLHRPDQCEDHQESTTSTEPSAVPKTLLGDNTSLDLNDKDNTTEDNQTDLPLFSASLKPSMTTSSSLESNQITLQFPPTPNPSNNDNSSLKTLQSLSPSPSASCINNASLEDSKNKFESCPSSPSLSLSEHSLHFEGVFDSIDDNESSSESFHLVLSRTPTPYSDAELAIQASLEPASSKPVCNELEANFVKLSEEESTDHSSSGPTTNMTDIVLQPTSVVLNQSSLTTQPERVTISNRVLGQSLTQSFHSLPAGGLTVCHAGLISHSAVTAAVQAPLKPSKPLPTSVLATNWPSLALRTSSAVLNQVSLISQPSNTVLVPAICQASTVSQLVHFVPKETAVTTKLSAAQPPNSLSANQTTETLRTINLKSLQQRKVPKIHAQRSHTKSSSSSSQQKDYMDMEPHPLHTTWDKSNRSDANENQSSFLEPPKKKACVTKLVPTKLSPCSIHPEVKDCHILHTSQTPNTQMGKTNLITQINSTMAATCSMTSSTPSFTLAPVTGSTRTTSTITTTRSSSSSSYKHSRAKSSTLPASEQEPAQLSEYQVQVLLLLLLRMRYQDHDYEIGVEMDPLTRITTVVIKCKSIFSFNQPEFQVQVKYDGSDNSETVCLESFSKYKMDAKHNKFIEFTNFEFSESVRHGGIFEQAFNETNPLNLKLLSFKTEFEGREQIMENLAMRSNKDRKMAESYLQNIRFAVGQPGKTQIENFIKQELSVEITNQEHIEDMYKKLFVWASMWSNSNEKRENTLKTLNTLRSKTKSEIDEAYKTFRSELKVHFNVLVPKSNFFGRQKELDWMMKVLKHGELKIIDLVITGSEGVGKSELVAKYIELHEEEYSNIVVLNAESEESLLESLRQSSLKYNLGVDDPTAGKKLLINKLYEFFKGKKSLIVFENVDSQDSIQQLVNILPLSKNHAPSIIVTSKQRKWINRNVIFLDVFTKDEACIFLKKNLSGKCDSVLLEKLAESLSFHPFALQLASSCINREVDSFRVMNSQGTLRKKVNIYLVKIKKLKETFKQNNGNSGTSISPLYIAWQMTKSAIKTENYGNIALKVFEMMAFMKIEEIELKVFLWLNEISNLEDESEWEDGEEEEPASKQLVLSIAISLLRTFSLVEASNGKASVHVALHKVVRSSLCNEPHREKEVLDSGLAAAAKDNKINEMIYDINATNFTPSYLFNWIQIFNHTLKYKDLIIKYCHLVPKLIFDVFHRTQNTGQVLLSNAILQTITGLVGSEAIESGSNDLLSVYFSARILLTRKIYLDHRDSLSERFYKEVFAKQESTFGFDHPDILFSIAFRAYYKLDRIRVESSGCLEEYQKTKTARMKILDDCRVLLKAYKKLLAVNHFSALKLLNVIAEELVNVDWTYESLMLFKKLMQRRQELRKSGCQINNPISGALHLLPSFDSSLQKHFDDKKCQAYLSMCLEELKLSKEIHIEEIHKFIHYIDMLQHEKNIEVSAILKDILVHICESPHAYQLLYELTMHLFVNQQHEIALKTFEAVLLIQSLEPWQLKMTCVITTITKAILTGIKVAEEWPKIEELDNFLDFVKRFENYSLFLHSLYKALQENSFDFATNVLDRLWNLRGLEAYSWKVRVIAFLKEFADSLLESNKAGAAWTVYQDVILGVGKVNTSMKISHSISFPKSNSPEPKKLKAQKAKLLLEKECHFMMVL